MIKTINLFFPLYDSNSVYSLADKAGFTEDELWKLDVNVTSTLHGKKIHYSYPAIINMAEKYPGIESICLQRNFTSHYYCRLIIRINPQELLEQKHSTSLFDGYTENRVALYYQFYTAMRTIFGTELPNLLDLHFWYVEQIEYAMDIYMQTRQNVNTYAQIVEDRIYSSWRYLERKFDCECEPDLLNPRISVEALVDGIARLKILRKYDNVFWPEINEDLYVCAWDSLLRDSAIYDIWHYYQGLIGFGDFYTKAQTTDLVENSDYGECIKDKLMLFLAAGDLSKDIISHRDKFKKGISVLTPKRMRKRVGPKHKRLQAKGSLATYDKFTQYLLELNINAVPINYKLRNSIYTEHFINPLKPIDFGNEPYGYSVNITPPEEFEAIKYSPESGIASAILSCFTKKKKR